MNPATFLAIAAPTIETIGTILIALVVLSVHMHIATERKIDEVVIKNLRREKMYIIVGLILVVVGYGLEIYIRLN